MTAVESDHDRPLPGQVLKKNQPSILIGKLEQGHPISHGRRARPRADRLKPTCEGIDRA